MTAVKEALLAEILKNMDNLPELPFVALQVNNLLRESNVSSKDLARIIMVDPALTSKVLKLCNSAIYGLSRQIKTISEAVSILGNTELQRIIYSILSQSVLDRPVEGYALEKGMLWENAITCAVYSRAIAKKVGYHDEELAFIAALLRDIGKVGLAGYVAEHGLALEESARKQQISFDQAEESLIGLNHTELGMEIAMRWNLPESLVLTLGYHHHPSKLKPDVSQSDKELVALVHLGGIFTMMSGRGIGLDGLMYPMEPVVLDILKLPKDQQALEALYSEMISLDADIEALKAAFGGEAGR